MGSDGVEDQDIIAKWMRGSMKEITQDSRDRVIWRTLIRGAARAGDRHS